jgi:hypothetical protein
MFKQENAAFDINVQKYGCYFFCLLRICEIESGGELTVEQINAIYLGAKERGYIGTKCSCLDPDGICKLSMAVLKCDKIVLQVGALDKFGTSSFWNWANKKPYNEPQYIALTFATGGPIGTHYVLANAKQEIIFDPSTHDYTQNAKLGGLWHTVIGG